MGDFPHRHESLLHFNVMGTDMSHHDEDSLLGGRVKCDSPRHDSVVDSLLQAAHLHEEEQYGEKENEESNTRFNNEERFSNKPAVSQMLENTDKEMVMIALHYDDKDKGAIPLPIREEKKPRVVMESIGTEEGSVGAGAVSTRFGFVDAADKKSDDEQTYLYVTQETLDKLITSASSDHEDVFLSCQEVETQHGKVLMMTPDKEGTGTGTTAAAAAAPAEQEEIETSSVPLDVTEEMINDSSDFGSTRGAYSSNLEDKFSSSIYLGGSNAGVDYLDTRCLICDTGFTDTTALRIHCARHHPARKNSLFRCWECKSTFKTPQSYIDHKDEMHQAQANVCMVCGVLLSTQRSLLQHLNSHLKRLPYKCDLCSRTFRHPGSLKDHVKYKHKSVTVDEGLFCDQCGKEFAHKRSLIRHMNQIHLKNKVECDTCQKSYSSISSLYHHQRTIHAHITFHCGCCSKVFKSVSAVKKHEKLMHQDVEEYRATPTEKVYNYSQYVSVDVPHDRALNTTTHIKCMFCAALFYQHDAYSIHCTKFHQDESAAAASSSAD